MLGKDHIDHLQLLLRDMEFSKEDWGQRIQLITEPLALPTEESKAPIKG